jgi:FMN-dependent NADH-azoreductase
VAHLLHIDSSIRGDASVSRELTARAAAVWRAAHPDGTVTYRDLGRDPLPHLDAAGGLAAAPPRDQHSAAQAESWALTEELVSEIKEADTIVLGLPLYNFGAPSSVKAWVDHLIAPGLSIDPETHAGLLGGRDFVVLASRGGGYASGPGLALAQSGEDDTDYGYYDTPSGNIWRPGAEPGQPPETNPGGRAAPRPRSGGRTAAGRTAALVPFPDRPHVASPPRARIRTS